ncbi:4-(cytidine 5'-diphospho)-2-C-methyl-D-erythritol kinase [Brevundimonas sp.]|uniref:4-(cytidine 5'-diphospho)-2-C-methyl-D-erythritol kinase n=1 Tax=Brevundimonas sp. TaxID=1871086 RepID=UPI003AF669CC
MSWVEAAPAKVNLFLHVGPVEVDGYHPLCSLVAFADVGDRLMLDPDGTPGLSVVGPFAGALTGASAAQSDNLVLRALAAWAAATGLDTSGLSLTLDKRLPIAAGLGGGSADAGAALRLVQRYLAPEQDGEPLVRAAQVVGADGPMCLAAVSAWAEGRGQVLTPEPRLPTLHAVLVNPGLPSPTGAVYGAFDRLGAGRADRPADPVRWDAGAVIGWLAEQRNDLEAPALLNTPAIGAALDAVRAEGQARLVRMSGSGATVFGLYDDAGSAARAAGALAEAHPGWWVRPARLG